MNKITQHKNIVIIGGGIAGLSAAFYLQKDKRPDLSIALIEKADHLGGKIQTESINDCLIESAPDCFLTRKNGGVELCRELGILDQLQGRRPEYHKTYVLRSGKLHALPEGLTGLVPTNMDAIQQSTLLSEAGKARFQQELQTPVNTDDDEESITDFMCRRFGEEVYNNLIEPLMAGIYGGNGEHLSINATFPQLRELEKKYGSVIKGLQKTAATKKADESYPPFSSLPLGMSQLVDTLVDRLTNVEILKCLGVESIALLQDHPANYQLTLSNGEVWSADHIIITTPAFVTAKLLAPIDEKLSQWHADMLYGSCSTISLAFNAQDIQHPLDGYGYVIPRIENSSVLACTWTSRKWAGRAPDDTILIRVYLKDTSTETVSLDLALKELKNTLGITASPQFYRLYHWPLSMPQYTLGHLKRVKNIETRLAQFPGLQVAGAAYYGVGIPDCIMSGKQACERIMNSVNPQCYAVVP